VTAPYLTASYVDRGDPATSDFTENDLINDNLDHPLDLSAIVPAGAKAVNLLVYIKSPTVDNAVLLRKNGNIYTNNEVRCRTQAANVRIGFDVTCAVAEDRKITYKIAAITWGFIRINVKGWWL